MSEPTTDQLPVSPRQVCQMADEILDYRAALGRIRDHAVSHDLSVSSVITLGNRLVNIRTEAVAVLSKVRR